MAKKQKNRHVKKHNLHQDRQIRYLLANFTGPIRERYFRSNTLLDTGIKPVNTACTNTTQLLQIAATDEFRYRNETGLASESQRKHLIQRDKYERHRDVPKYP